MENGTARDARSAEAGKLETFKFKADGGKGKSPGAEKPKQRSKKVHSSTRRRMELQNLEDELQDKLKLMEQLESENELLQTKMHKLQSCIKGEAPDAEVLVSSTQQAANNCYGALEPPLAAAEPGQVAEALDHSTRSALLDLKQHREVIKRKRHICASSHKGRDEVVEKMHACWSALMEKTSNILCELDQLDTQAPAGHPATTTAAAAAGPSSRAQHPTRHSSRAHGRHKHDERAVLLHRLSRLAEASVLVMRTLLDAGPCYTWCLMAKEPTPHQRRLPWSAQAGAADFGAAPGPVDMGASSGPSRLPGLKLEQQIDQQQQQQSNQQQQQQLVVPPPGAASPGSTSDGSDWRSVDWFDLHGLPLIFMEDDATGELMLPELCDLMQCDLAEEPVEVKVEESPHHTNIAPLLFLPGQGAPLAAAAAGAAAAAQGNPQQQQRQQQQQQHIAAAWTLPACCLGGAAFPPLEVESIGVPAMAGPGPPGVSGGLHVPGAAAGSGSTGASAAAAQAGGAWAVAPHGSSALNCIECEPQEDPLPLAGQLPRGGGPDQEQQQQPSSPGVSEELWLRGLTALQLQPEQSRQLLGLLQKLRRSQRYQLLQQTKLGKAVAQSTGQGLVDLQSQGVCGEGALAHGAATLQLLEQLADAFSEGHESMRDFMLAVWGPESPLTLKQRCCGMVACFPYFPDAITLVELHETCLVEGCPL